MDSTAAPTRTRRLFPAGSTEPGMLVTAADVATFNRFADGMIRRMTVSFHKYGYVAKGYPHNVDALASLDQRLELYRSSANTETMMDAANFAMIEFMHPKLTDAAAGDTPVLPEGHIFRYWVGRPVSYPTGFELVSTVDLRVMAPSCEYSAEFIRLMGERFTAGQLGVDFALHMVAAYRMTKDRTYLVGAALGFLGEFMAPSIAGAEFAGTDADGSPGRTLTNGSVTAERNDAVAA